MGKGYKQGGANPLNFKVVPGLTQPGTASKNTIWVKTERIGAWYFSATQPENMQEWDVWFLTGTESDVTFNALRKNGLQVYPLSAKQMVEGTLVDVVAKSNQNGEWVEWVTYLYNSGNEFSDLTGGWSARAWRNNQNFSAGVPTLTKNASDMTIALTVYGGTLSGVVEVGKDIDLTNTKTIRAIFSSVNASGVVISSAYPCVQLVVVGRSATYYFVDHVAGAERGFLSVGTENDVVVEIDVSNISGKHDIAVGLSCYSDGAQTITAVLKSVEMV